MASPRVFERRMSNRGGRIMVRADLHKKKIINAIHDELVRRTPVDTGLARSNWQVTVGGPATGTVPIRSQTATIAAGKAALRSARRGATIYITNNVLYIRFLNQGWSGQAPAGFVQMAVLAGRAKAGDPRLLDK